MFTFRDDCVVAEQAHGVVEMCCGERWWCSVSAIRHHHSLVTRQRTVSTGIESSASLVLHVGRTLLAIMGRFLWSRYQVGRARCLDS